MGAFPPNSKRRRPDSKTAAPAFARAAVKIMRKGA